MKMMRQLNRNSTLLIIFLLTSTQLFSQNINFGFEVSLQGNVRYQTYKEGMYVKPLISLWVDKKVSERGSVGFSLGYSDLGSESWNFPTGKSGDFENGSREVNITRNVERSILVNIGYGHAFGSWTIFLHQTSAITTYKSYYQSRYNIESRTTFDNLYSRTSYGLGLGCNKEVAINENSSLVPKIDYTAIFGNIHQNRHIVSLGLGYKF
jgi:hypothetical protein